MECGRVHGDVERDMPITSYIVRCQPGSETAVAERLRRWPQVTLGAVSRAGLAFVIDSQSIEEAEALVAQLEASPGVVQALPVYHNFEDTC